MMIKEARASDWPGLLSDTPAVDLIKMSSRGLRGSDFQVFLKRAGHPAVLAFEKIAFYPGEVPVHLIALGATEGYGCFFAGTPVQTDSGFKNIEDIYVGERVLTHANRYRAVTHVFKKAYTGTRTTIKVTGLPLPMVSTGSHPYYVIRKKAFSVQHRCPCFLNTKGIRKEDAVNEAVHERADFVRADSVRPGDFVVIPIGRTENYAEALPDDEAYLLGLYLAEGCVLNRNYDGERSITPDAVIYTVNAVNDDPIIREVTRQAIEWGYLISTGESLTSELGLRLTLSRKDFAETCAYLMGRESTEKFLHPQIFAQSREWKLSFLGAYFDGDGCVNTTGKPRYRGVLRANTASLNLAIDIQRLLASLGIISSVSRLFNRESNGCFGTGDQPIYEISVGSAYALPVLERCKRLHPVEIPPRKKQASGHASPDYLLLPVDSVYTDTIVETVKYNLEVEEDNTFTTFAISHNSNRNGDSFKIAACRDYHKTFEKYARFYRSHLNRDPAKSYGLVKLAIYNEPMKRIELIVALNGTKEAAERNGGLIADEEMDKLASKEDIPVSMSIKVPYDICNGCFNKAATRDEYCASVDEGGCCKYGGLKRNLTKVSEDGHILYADNPEGVWFDISNVRRPADRTAYTSGVLTL